MIQVGQTVKQFVNFSPDKTESRPTDKEALYGTVIYVHPNRRFYTVEFTMWNGSKIRACFPDFYPTNDIHKNILIRHL